MVSFMKERLSEDSKEKPFERKNNNNSLLKYTCSSLLGKKEDVTILRPTSLVLREVETSGNPLGVLC